MESVPKIIKDLREKIIKTAITIFNEQGFDAIDIRKIAKECNVAVGTLYNYFPNKKEVVYEVFNELWYESMNKLEALIDSSEGNEDLFVDYILSLYKEMEKKKGIGLYLFRMEIIESKDEKVEDGNFLAHSKFHERHAKQIGKLLIKSYGLGDAGDNNRELDNLINTVATLIITNKGADVEYVMFIRDMVSSYVRDYRERLCK